MRIDCTEPGDNITTHVALVDTGTSESLMVAAQAIHASNDKLFDNPDTRMAETATASLIYNSAVAIQIETNGASRGYLIADIVKASPNSLLDAYNQIQFTSNGKALTVLHNSIPVFENRDSLNAKVKDAVREIASKLTDGMTLVLEHAVYVPF